MNTTEIRQQQPTTKESKFWEQVNALKRDLVTDTWNRNNQNISKTARALGLSLGCAKLYLRKFGLIQSGK